MGGKIWVESKEGIGTQFHFTMVLNATEEEPPLPTPPLLSDVHPDDKRCLVIEHSLLVRELLCRDIGNVGLQGDAVPDFAEAQKHVRTTRYAVIIVDGSLADSNTFIRELVNVAPAARVILTSNLGMVPHLDDANVVTTLIKPIRRWRLINALDKALDRSPTATMRETMGLHNSTPREIRRQTLASLAKHHPLRILVLPRVNY
jgi:DNA-binding NtrC family response regulator